MSNKPSYQDQLLRKISAYRKVRNFLAVLYYSERLACLACTSWESFKGSWAGEHWIKQHQSEADELARNHC